MLFNSAEFIVFLTVVYGLYLVLPHRGQNWMLLVASYVFYGWWDWRFLSLILFTTVLDYWVSLKVFATQEPRLKKWFLSISVVANLGLLGAFKYFNFFVQSFIDLASSVG